MRVILRASVLAVVSFGLVLPVWAEKPDEKPKVKFEIRRAETKPADGLIKATVAGSTVYLHPVADATSADISGARVVADGERVAIDLTFTQAGAKKMAKASEQHLDKPLAILIDGKVVAALTVRVKISEGARITGSFTREEAEAIVKAVTAK
jgi:preprotein translocase subunit SecD